MYRKTLLLLSLLLLAAIDPINIGITPDDGTGDDLRTAFQKVNSNFAELDNKATVVSDYTELLATTSERVTVTDVEYGGQFLLSNDQASPAIVGVRIQRTDLSYLDRVWDGKNYLLDWANLDTYNDDAGTALDVVFTAFNGDVVVYGREGVVYTVKKMCDTDGIPINLRDIRFKRVDARNSVTTAIISNGATSVTVADASSFVVGDLVLLSDGLSRNNNTTDLRSITAITDNTVTVNTGLTRSTGTSDWPVGSTLFTSQVAMFRFKAATQPVTLNNVHFDGNAANNLFTLDWSVNWTIISNSFHGTINDCHFINTPCENLGIQGSWVVSNCYGENLYGSFSHGSDPTGIYPATTKYLNCTIKEVGKIATLITPGVLDHNEGAITWSSNVGEVEIDQCTITNAYQRLFSDIAGDDKNVFVTNSRFKDAVGICKMSSGATTLTTHVAIEGNYFENCGDIYITGTNLAKSQAFYGVRIANCEFRGNTRIWAGRTSDIELQNLRIIYADSPIFSTQLISGVTTTYPKQAAIQLPRPDRLKIDNVYIEAPKSFVTELEYGIAILPSHDGGLLRKDSGGTNTAYYYPQSVDVKNVTLANFRFGIVSDDTITRTWLSTVEGWRFSDITVYGPPDLTHTPAATSAAGIVLAPGTIANDLRVYSMYSGNASWYPYILYGIHSSSTAVASQRGSMVDGLWLIGPSNRGLQIGATVANRSNYNVFVRNAFVSNNTNGNVNDLVNSVQTTDIGAATLPPLTTENAQKFFRRAENSGAY